MGTDNKQLEAEKLRLEIRLLKTQTKWERWKSPVTIVVSLVTLAALIGGGLRYFLDEHERQKLRREEVFTLGLRDLASSDELVRAGAVTTLVSYADQDRNYADRVVTLLAHRGAVETSVMVKRTIIGNLRRLKQHYRDRPLYRSVFEDFEGGVRDELARVNKDLSSKAWKQALDPEKEKYSLLKQKNILQKIQELLRTIP